MRAVAARSFIEKESKSTTLRCWKLQRSNIWHPLVFQIKFEHFSFGFADAVRRDRNASKRSGRGGRLHGPSPHGSKSHHSLHGLRRRRRKSSATAHPQQPGFVTPKVRTAIRGETHRQSGSQTARFKTLRGAVASPCPRLLMRGRVMNSYLKLQFSGFECSHVVETHFLPFSSRFPCQV